MDTRIYGATDLKTRRTELLGAAVKDRALVRAVDGTALVLTRLDRVDAQECVATWALRLHAAGTGPLPAELAWLDVLEVDDRELCLAELWAALGEVRAGDDRSVFDELLRAWRTTAATLEDPRRRQVLLGPFSEDDFVPAPRPE